MMVPLPLPLSCCDSSQYIQNAKNHERRLPLHYACGNQASSSVVRILLEQNPKATMTAGPSSMLPIHFLARWGPSSLGVVDMLLLANPNVLIAKAEDEGLTPLDMAREGEYPERDEVMDALSRLAQPNHSPLRPLLMPRISRAPNPDAAIAMISGAVGGIRASPNRMMSPTSCPQATAGHRTIISNLVEKMEVITPDRDTLKGENGNFNKTADSMRKRLSEMEENLSAARGELESTRAENGTRDLTGKTKNLVGLEMCTAELEAANGTVSDLRSLLVEAEARAEKLRLSRDGIVKTVAGHYFA